VLDHVERQVLFLVSMKQRTSKWRKSSRRESNHGQAQDLGGPGNLHDEALLPLAADGVLDSSSITLAGSLAWPRPRNSIAGLIGKNLTTGPYLQ
jgi:hypothetical protein